GVLLYTATFILMPYTTLFRSEGHGLGVVEHVPVPDRGQDQQQQADEPTRGAAEQAPELPRAEQAEAGDQRAEQVNGRVATKRRDDRKSTRLNSSHVKNSYAVF